MKALWAAAAVGITLMGSVGSAPAQPYGGYGGGGYGSGGGYGGGGYDERNRGYGERDRGYGDRGRGGDRYAFDEGEYLRCNPDVRRAVNRGQMESGLAHYRAYGRNERRRLSC